MINKFNKFPELSNPILMALFDFVNSKGFEIYFVGGLVRDRILNLKVFDIDITTNAPISLIIGYINRNKCFFNSLFLDKHYGTVFVNLNKEGESNSIQISPMRRDIKTDGRQAKIVLTNKRFYDAKRRDFTINALYMDRNGIIFDDVGGLKDLQYGKIRFIGCPWRRIKEDYLRILRLYRFYARFGRSKLTLFSRFCVRFYAKYLNMISKERIRSEIFGILNSRNCVEAVNLMNEDLVSKVVFGQKVDVDVLRYVVNKNASVLLRLFVCCKANPRQLRNFVLTKQEKVFYKCLIHSLKHDELGPKARLVLYGIDVCIADNIITNRLLSRDSIPDFSKIRANLVKELLNRGIQHNHLSKYIKSAYYKWLLSDCSLKLDDLLS